MKDNVNKTDYGYEIIWAVTEDYCSKILVFEHIGSKTPMVMHKDVTKSWFVNVGVFRIKWIDTTTGKLYEKDINEGSVFHVPPMMPVSVESLFAGASLSQTSNKDEKLDKFVIIPDENIKND